MFAAVYIVSRPLCSVWLFLRNNDALDPIWKRRAGLYRN